MKNNHYADAKIHEKLVNCKMYFEANRKLRVRNMHEKQFWHLKTKKKHLSLNI